MATLFVGRDLRILAPGIFLCATFGKTAPMAKMRRDVVNVRKEWRSVKVKSVSIVVLDSSGHLSLKRSPLLHISFQ